VVVSFIGGGQCIYENKMNNSGYNQTMSQERTLDFPHHMSWSFVVVFSELRWEVIVRFVDVSRIDDYHCFYFLSII